MKIDLLAFGAHPDDVELSCSGLLLVEKQNGKKIGVVDLTRGELGSRGDVETRNRESEKASSILGLDIRINLELPDGFFNADKESLLKVIQVIRKYKPDFILCNAPNDRHPDHGKAAILISEASFLSGLLKIETSFEGVRQTPWRPRHIFNYIQDNYLEPNFFIDITHVFDKKMASIHAYQSQFYNPLAEGPQTYISTPEFMEFIINRNKLFGKRIGVPYAEGYITKKEIGLKNLDAIVEAVI